MTTRYIAVAITKGGTGKTTTVCNLGHGLARRGRRVLLVDCDTQAHVSTYWNITPKRGHTLAEVLTGTRPATRCIVSVRPDLDMLASDRASLAGAKLAMAQDPTGQRAYWLRDRLAEIGGYDDILLDTAPSWDVLSMAALLACDDVLIPISTEYLTLASAADYVKAIDDVKQHNARLRVRWILPTFLDGRSRRSGDVLAVLRKTFGALVVDPVRVNTDLSTAASYHQSIFEYAPTSRGAEDYGALVERVTQ